MKITQDDKLMSTNKELGKQNKSKTIVMLCQDNRIDRRILDESRSLQNAGWKVTVIAGAPQTIDYRLDEDTYPDIEIVRLELGYIPQRITEHDGKNLLFSEVDWQKIYVNHNQLLEIGLNHPADVYVAHDLPQVPIAIILANHFGAHATYDAHELYPEQFSNDQVRANLNSEAEAFILPFVDKVIMVNKSGASFMAIKYGIDTPEIILNSPSLDVNDLPIKNTNILRKNLGIEDSKRILLYQGGVARIKNDVRNLEKLMLSMEFVKSEDVVLVYMGPGGHGKEELINIAKEKGLYKTRFYYHEPVTQNELLDYTVSADAGVIPYPHIDFNTYFCTPNKLFEFMVSGIPILANSSPELNDFVSGQGIGVNRPMKSIEGIATAIDEFFNSDFNTYKQTVKRLSKDYIWDVQGARVVDIYNSLVKTESHSSQIRNRVEEVATMLMTKQNNKIASAICKTFLKYNSDDIEILRLLSNIYFNMGDYNSSKRELGRLLKLVPEDEAALFFINKVNDLIYEQENGFLQDLKGSDSIDFIIDERDEEEKYEEDSAAPTNGLLDVKITACIYTRNRAGYLKHSIESILKQKYAVHELIIVDDYSSDNTQEVVNKCLSDKVKFFTNKEHLGISASRNICIAEASGDYLLWIGDDDILLENTTDSYRSILSNSPDTEIIYGNIQVFDDETGKEITIIEPKDYTDSSQSLLADLFKGSGITDGGSLVKKSVYGNIGNYDIQFNRASDNEFWSRASEKAKFHKCDEVVYKYRKHTSNVSFSNTVDRSFESVVLRRLLVKYNIREIFPFLNWQHEESAKQYANIIIAKSLHNNQDYHNALQYLSTLDLRSVSAEVLNLAAYTYLFMGDYEGFESFVHLCNDNGLMPEDILNNLVNNYNSYREFVNKIEECIADNNVSDVKGYFQEAKRLFGYTFNVAYCLGVLYEALNDQKNAYQYFKDAVRMNPLNQNAIVKAAENALDDAQRDEIVKLSERILKTPEYKSQKVEESSYQEFVKNEVQVSVIIPTYNRKDKLGDAIKSVLNQTFEDFEIIVVNDAGEDVTDLVSNMDDERVRLISHEENRGLAAARNTGLRNAKGKYIAFLDDDDVFYTNHLDVAVTELKSGSRVVYTDAVRKSYKIEDGEYLLTGISVPYSIDYDRNKLLIGNIAPVNCFVFEKELVDKSAGFDEELKVLEDWEFWLRLSGLVEFKHIKQNTVQVNWFDDGSTMTSSKTELFNSTRSGIYKQYEKEIERIPDRDAIVEEFNAIWREDLQTTKPLASIIVLSYNQVEYTLNFIDSVYKHTRTPYEVILIDNNSDTKTKELLKQKLGNEERIKLIFNDKNVGFPIGINQALQVAKGSYKVIANNDILVTDGWLERMIRVAESDEAIGIVGPISNSVSGVQLDKNAKYDSIEAMYEYAKKNKDRSRGRYEEFPRVAFLCTLIKKEVVDKIGGLDERFTPGNFEDDDFCLRVQLAGYKTIIAQDVFIHHFGSVSFKANGNEEYLKRLEINKQKFVSKWGADPEEIWLQGKPIKTRSLNFSINTDEFNQNLERAFAELESKDYLMTLNYLEKAKDLFNEANSTISYLDLLNLLGNTALLCNELEKANTYFEDELKSKPDSSRACLGMGQVFNTAGMNSEAKAMLEYAVLYDDCDSVSIELLREVNKKLELEPDHNSLMIKEEQRI